MRRTFGKILITVGLGFLLVSGFLVWQRNTPTRLAFKIAEIKTNASPAQLSATVPTLITIPGIDVELPIIPTELIDGKWQATGEGVSWLKTTPLPGDTGNSILYGHNWPNLLGRLPLVKPGQTIDIRFSDGSVRTFDIEFTSVVTPDQTHILNTTADRRLTLYTCTGFLDTKRFVVTAIFTTP